MLQKLHVACRNSHIVDQTVEMDGGRLLCVHTDDVTAGLDEVGYPLFGLHNHPARDVCHERHGSSPT